jgi:hypothetical protein
VIACRGQQNSVILDEAATRLELMKDMKCRVRVRIGGREMKLDMKEREKKEGK